MFLRSGHEKPNGKKISTKRIIYLFLVPLRRRKRRRSVQPGLHQEVPQDVQDANVDEAPQPALPVQVSYDDIYLDPKNAASFSSNVHAFMAQKKSISVHKRKIRNFRRRPIIVPGPYHSISADLIDYQMFSRKNHGYKYILCVIDMFSRYNYVRPLHGKTAQEVAGKLEEIIGSMKFVPRFFTSDKGGEFDIRNTFIKSVLEDNYHMVVYYTTGPKKNSMVERFNRTLKERIERYFTENKTKTWVDILEDFSNNINHSVNRSIGMPPSEVTLENAKMIRDKLYPDRGKKVLCDKILVGDRVRVVLPKQVFDKGYRQAWTDEIFTVEKIEKSMGFCLYILRNNLDVVLPRKFYLSELNFISRYEPAPAVQQ